MDPLHTLPQAKVDCLVEGKAEAIRLKNRNKNMQSLDDMPVNDAIALYYEKHHAMRQGDMKKLLELKNKCPDIFDKENQGMHLS